ncbi:MAG: hypothetical protein ACR2K5_06695 [Pseudolabrys sp.]
MNVAKIFFAYMALCGIAAGALLVAMPPAGDFVIKPYFWLLIAVALFDGGLYLSGRGGPAAALNMSARIIGFIPAAVLMLAIATLAGSPARLF